MKTLSFWQHILFFFRDEDTFKLKDQDIVETIEELITKGEKISKTSVTLGRIYLESAFEFAKQFQIKEQEDKIRNKVRLSRQNC